MVRMRLNISNVDEFEEYFGLRGIDTTESDSGTNNTIEYGMYWKIAEEKTDKYNAYYYYQNVLSPNESTTPLFTQILYKSETEGYIPFYVIDEESSTDEKTVYKLNDAIEPSKANEALLKLNNITITLYQESVAVKVKDWNADENGDGVIDANGDATLIWKYFDSEVVSAVE